MEIREERQLSPRMLISITKSENQKKLEELFDELRVPICYQCRGKGTAPSEIMDIFGFTGTTRLVTMVTVPKFMIQQLFDALHQQLSFHQKGAGIAITIPITGIQSHLLHLLSDEARTAAEANIEGDIKEMKEKSEYTAIWVSVSSGYSDDVIDAARDAGARGGTVIKGRRRGSERACQHFGISIQEEQDFVMIVVPRDKKHAVTSAISSACGLNSPAHGVVISMPVDDAMGLE